MENFEENRLEQIAQLVEKIRKLPPELQSAIAWSIENLDKLIEMGKDSEMTLEEIQSKLENAWAEEQYATLALLYITKFMKENEEL